MEYIGNQEHDPLKSMFTHIAAGAKKATIRRSIRGDLHIYLDTVEELCLISQYREIVDSDPLSTFTAV